MKLIAGALITAVLLAVVPNNSVAATKYKYNTYRQGYQWVMTEGGYPGSLENQMNIGQITSETTGKPIKTKAVKWCKGFLDAYSGKPIFSPNAVKGCTDAAVKWILING